jgi:hypothetical protein
MDEAEHGELLRRAFEYQLALVSNPRISADDFTKTQRVAKDIFEDIAGVQRPWLGRSKEDRQMQDTTTFKEQWERLAGFSVDDEEALAAWSERIANHTAATEATRIAKDQEEAERQGSFHSKLEAVRRRRLNQQGRI